MCPSSLSKSSRYVGILYAGVLFFTAAMFGAMYAITGSTSGAPASLPGALERYRGNSVAGERDRPRGDQDELASADVGVTLEMMAAVPAGS